MKKRYIINPYVHALSIFGLIAMLVSACLLTYFRVGEHFGRGLTTIIREGWDTFLILIVLFGSCFIGTILDSFSFWGIVVFNSIYLEAKAPLRRTIKIDYSEVRDIGIDFGVINYSRQFWIYISKTRIDPRYLRAIHQLPINKNTIKIQYSQEVFDVLLHVLPPHLKNQLEKAKSVVCVYKTD